jgi:hypothetical protein
LHSIGPEQLESAWFQPFKILNVISWFQKPLLFQMQLVKHYVVVGLCTLNQVDP